MHKTYETKTILTIKPIFQDQEIKYFIIIKNGKE